MPNLINVLRRTDNANVGKLTDEERRKVVHQALKGPSAIGEAEVSRGMDWGTCMIFSCEKDCCNEGVKEYWQEEIVLIQVAI